eukprot:4833235-Prymnesium_polylepis.1
MDLALLDVTPGTDVVQPRLQQIAVAAFGRAVRSDQAPKSHRDCASACDCEGRFKNAVRARAA